MAYWHRELKLNPEWRQAQEREITPQEFGRSAAAKLRRIRDFDGFPHLNQERDELAEQFEDFANDATGDFDDVDDLMQALYDWGDSTVGGTNFFNAEKACWIDSTTRVEVPA